MLDKYYQPPNSALWQGRADSQKGRYFQQVICWDIRQGAQPSGVVFLGFACDVGVKRNHGRLGAEQGPEHLRMALGRLPYHGPNIPLYDGGDILCPDDNLEVAQEVLGKAISALRAQGHFVILLGGGHETAWGHYQGLSDISNLHIVNWDAHFDMRDGQPSSGTPFLQVAQQRREQGLSFHYHCFGIQPTANSPALYQTAKIWQVDTLEASQILEASQRLIALLEQEVSIYLTLCLDVFSHAVAPGVSAPQAGGLLPEQVLPGIRLLAASGKVAAFDVVELSPPFDRDNMTSQLAALCIAEFLHAKKV